MKSNAMIPFGIGLPIPTGRRTVAIDPLSMMLAPLAAGEMALTDAIGGFRVDIKETDEQYDVKADFPGAEKGDVDIKLEDDVLTISYEKKEEAGEKDDDGNWLTHERSYASMKRSFTLPYADEDKTTASLADGVLTVVVPKKEPEQTTKTIEIS